MVLRTGSLALGRNRPGISLVTPNMPLNLVGPGPADIAIENLRNDGVRVSIVQVDVAKDSSPTTASLTPKAFEVRGHRISNAGRYRIDFKADPGAYCK
jgi:hypothetical protein